MNIKELEKEYGVQIDPALDGDEDSYSVFVGVESEDVELFNTGYDTERLDHDLYHVEELDAEGIETFAQIDGVEYIEPEGVGFTDI